MKEELPKSLIDHNNPYNQVANGYRKATKQAMIFGSGIVTVALIILLLIIIF